MEQAITERKKCISCGRYLGAFHGHYFHPEAPCNGIQDYLFFEATVEDKFLHDNFVKLYGQPDIDDYDRVKLLEDNRLGLIEHISQQNKKLNNRLVRALLWLLNWFKKT